MATTTNYGWTTPDDTDLVKNGASAIRTLGSSADTTVKNLNPGTTAGDVDYYTSSTAKARLAIGTAGQVLTVNSGATAPQWSTPATGALTKIAGATFTNQASVAVDSVFSTTYRRYLVLVQAHSHTAAGTDDFQLQFRYAGSTQSAAYYGASKGWTRANAAVDGGFVNTAQCTLTTGIGSNADASCKFALYFSQAGTSSKMNYFGDGFSQEEAHAVVAVSGLCDTARTYDGFLLKSSSSNITGNYAVYGLAD